MVPKFSQRRSGASSVRASAIERDTGTWPGQIAMHLGSKLYFDLAEGQDFNAKMEQLAAKLLTMARDAGYKAAHTEPAGVSHPQAKKIEGTKVETGNIVLTNFEPELS